MPFARNALTALSVAAGYFACAVLGTLLSVPPSGFAIIWPATAFLISVMLILPPARWGWCAAGIVPVHFLLAGLLQPSAPLVVVATQVAGNLSLAAATVLAVRRWIAPQASFDTFRSVSLFIVIAGLAVPAVVNALVLSIHLATGWIDDLGTSWLQWMIAGVFPTITLPPLFVLARDRNLPGGLDVAHSARVELALLALPLFVLTFIALGGGVDTRHWPALFLTPFPFLLWAAVRLGVGGTCIALLVLAGAAITQALRSQGPFAAYSPMADVVSLQAFLITVSVPLILLAALMDDRRRVQSEADELRERLTHLREDERRRIAQELHDSTAQHVAAASLYLMQLKDDVAPDLRGLVEKTMQSFREAATEIRTFSYLLHPPQLRDEGLCAVLRQYLPGFERRTGVRTTLRISPLADRLPHDHQHALLRIAQESLGNVHRHARATTVSVSLRCIAGRTHLTIRDDGVGIKPEAGARLGERFRLGVGIPAMTSRVRQLGGRIDVSRRGRGTTVHVAIPREPPRPEKRGAAPARRASKRGED